MPPLIGICQNWNVYESASMDYSINFVRCSPVVVVAHSILRSALTVLSLLAAFWFSVSSPLSHISIFPKNIAWEKRWHSNRLRKECQPFPSPKVSARQHSPVMNKWKKVTLEFPRIMNVIYIAIELHSSIGKIDWIYLSIAHVIWDISFFVMKTPFIYFRCCVADCSNDITQNSSIPLTSCRFYAWTFS